MSYFRALAIAGGVIALTLLIGGATAITRDYLALLAGPLGGTRCATASVEVSPIGYRRADGAFVRLARTRTADDPRYVLVDGGEACLFVPSRSTP